MINRKVLAIGAHLTSKLPLRTQVLFWSCRSRPCLAMGSFHVTRSRTRLSSTLFSNRDLFPFHPRRCPYQAAPPAACNHQILSYTWLLVLRRKLQLRSRPSDLHSPSFDWIQEKCRRITEISYELARLRRSAFSDLATPVSNEWQSDASLKSLDGFIRVFNSSETQGWPLGCDHSQY